MKSPSRFLFVGLLLALLAGMLSAATAVTTCTNLTTADTYDVQNVINYNGGTCFNITAANVVLDGHNFFINGNNPAMSVGVNITSLNVTVKNLQVQGFDRGVELNSTPAQNPTNAANNDTLNNLSINVTKAVGIGINFLLSNFTMVNGTTIIATTLNSTGINASFSSNNTIANSTINMVGATGIANALYLNTSAQNWTIINNTLMTATSAAQGIVLAATTTNMALIANNTINVAGTTTNGILLIMSGNNSISNNTIYSALGAGINVTIYSNNNSITLNTINTTTGQAIYLNNVRNITMANNTLNTTTGVGILFNGTANMSCVANNTINTTSSGGSGLGATGILSLSGHNNTVYNNTIYTVGQDSYGIFLNSTSTNWTLQNNTISTTGATAHGIYINPPAASTATQTNLTLITLNTISVTGATAEAINLSSTANSINVTNNTLSSTLAVTLDVGANSTRVYFNNFTAGTVFINNAGTANVFNTSVGTANGLAQGNFYADIRMLNITDTNGDGFGDSGGKWPYNNANDANFTGAGADNGPMLPSSSTSGSAGVWWCQNLSGANINYTLMRNINTSLGPCLNISNDNITLDGSNFIINGANVSRTVGVNITALNATVKNLQIQNFQNGIDLNTTAATNPNHAAINNTINNVTINVSRNGGVGINFILANATYVNGTTINVTMNLGVGINSSTSHGNTIANSTIVNNGSGAAYGINLAATSQNWTIFNNTINTSGLGAYGINLAATGSNRANISRNTVNATAAGSICLNLVTSGNNTISLNNLYAAQGTAVNFTVASNNNSFTNNTVNTTINPAIVLDNSINNTIANNSINTSSGVAILFNTSSNLSWVVGNTINTTGSGGSAAGATAILSLSGSNNSVFNNTISTAGQDSYGIFLNASPSINDMNNSNWTLQNNTITTTGATAHGIYIYNNPANSTLITLNTISVSGASAEAINLSATNYNNLTNNTLSSTIAIALDLGGIANYTRVYNNNFTAGSKFIRNAGFNNTFNISNATGGNAQGNWYADLSMLNLFDSDNNGYGDTSAFLGTANAPYPYSVNSSLTPNWSGPGGDWAPHFARYYALNTTTFALGPDPAPISSNLTCNITFNSVANATPLLRYSWYQNGINMTALAGTATISNNTLYQFNLTAAGTSRAENDHWSCMVIADDGITNSTFNQTANITISSPMPTPSSSGSSTGGGGGSGSSYMPSGTTNNVPVQPAPAPSGTTPPTTPAPEISVPPASTPPAVDTPVTVQVNGASASGQTLEVQAPDGTIQTVTADANGKADFTPTQSGTYSVWVAGHTDTLQTFTVAPKAGSAAPSSAPTAGAGSGQHVTPPASAPSAPVAPAPSAPAPDNGPLLLLLGGVVAFIAVVGAAGWMMGIRFFGKKKGM